MKLSTRARYGMRMMLTLAVHYGEGPMYLRDIAAAEDISEKYLGLLAIPLRKAGLIRSSRGAYGGYSLARAPSQINLGEIVETLEGRGIVDCLIDPSSCPRFNLCKTRDIWAYLDREISDTLRSITLEQALSKLKRKPRGRPKAQTPGRKKTKPPVK